MQSSRHLFSPLSCYNRRETGGGRKLDPAVYQAMMAVIAEKGWSQATMPEIAARSLTNLEEIQRFYPTLHDLLAAYFDEQTWQLLGQPAAQLSPDSPFSHHREYLFALMMNYMDMLQPHRLAYRQMQRAWPTSPRLSRVLLTHAQQFLQQALQKSQLLSWLPATTASLLILPAWLGVLRAWHQDEGPDLSATMKKLDDQLRQAQEYWHYLPALVRRILAT